MSLPSVLLALLLYLTGVVFYSSLFLVTANQDEVAQTMKIAVAGLHVLPLILAVFLAQSGRIYLRIAGYLMIVGWIVYAIALVGFYRYFGFVPEVYTFGAGALGDLGEVLDHYVAQVLGVQEILLAVLGVAILIVVARFPLSPRMVLLPALSLALIGASVALYGSPARSERFGNAAVLKHFGPFVFLARSAGSGLLLEDGPLAPPQAFPGPLAALGNDGSDPPRSVPPPEGLEHVVLVQIESFDPEAIDAILSGQPVMPFVQALRDRCLTFEKHFTVKGAGGSADAEFAVATGLVPSLTLPALTHYDYARPTLYDDLAAAGVTATFAHDNDAGFYGRNEAYARMPDVRTVFLDPGQIVAEREFATDTLGDTLAAPGRSLHYFFNFKSHGPYRGYSAETEARFAADETPGLRFDYLATMSEVDAMIEALFDRQGADYDEGRSLFVLTADHPSYVFSSGDTISKFRIPMLLCHRDIAPRSVERVTSTVDLHATLRALFGLEPGATTLGRSLLEGGSDVALLPSGLLVRPGPSGVPQAAECGAPCARYIAYTEQYLSARP